MKLLRTEPSSADVRAAIATESEVIISVLAELETLVQLKAAWTGGSLTRNQWRQAEAKFGLLRNQPPVRVSRACFRGFPNCVASAPEFRRPALSLVGSLAPRSHGRVENLALDDAR